MDPGALRNRPRRVPQTLTNRKLVLLLVLLATGSTITVVLALGLGARTSSSLVYRELTSGDKVGLRCGLTFVMPPGSSGSLSGWPSPSEDGGNLTKPADSALVNLPGTEEEQTVFLESWRGGLKNVDYSAVKRTTELLSDPAENEIEVRWRKPAPGLFNIYILSELPGRLTGAVMFEEPRATNADQAWRAARRVWRRLSLSGAAFPSRQLGAGPRGTYDAAGQRTQSDVTANGTRTLTDYSYEGITLLKGVIHEAVHKGKRHFDIYWRSGTTLAQW